MKKVLEALLAGKQLEARNVLKLINCLNPQGREIALEMALGIYEAPQIPDYFGKEIVIRNKNIVVADCLYNPLTQEVEVHGFTQDQFRTEVPFKEGSEELEELKQKYAKMDRNEAYELGKSFSGSYYTFNLRTSSEITLTTNLKTYLNAKAIGEMEQ